MFEQIDHDDHLERIMFYEENTAFIFALEEEKQHYFTFHYIISLFESGKYENVLSEVDALIEYVFLNEVSYASANVYEDLLYKKAYSQYQLLKYEDAIHISEQLIGIDPRNERYIKLLRQSARAFFNFRSSGIRLTALILIFCSAIISAIVWFINTKEQDTTLAEAFVVIMSPCVLALAILGGAYLLSHIKASIRVNRLVEIKVRKKLSR